MVWSVCKAQVQFNTALHPTDVLQNSMSLPWLQTGREGIVWLHSTPSVLEPGLVEKRLPGSIPMAQLNLSWRPLLFSAFSPLLAVWTVCLSLSPLHRTLLTSKALSIVLYYTYYYIRYSLFLVWLYYYYYYCYCWFHITE